jgi:hypothetical protein
MSGVVHPMRVNHSPLKVVATGTVKSLSLASEPLMIRLLTRQHGFENSDVPGRPQFFEPDFAFLQGPYRDKTIKFDIDVGPHRASP